MSKNYYKTPCNILRYPKIWFQIFSGNPGLSAQCISHFGCTFDSNTMLSGYFNKIENSMLNDSFLL